MTKRTASLLGWSLIAALAAICFGLNQLRAQYLYFNWFVIFTLAASTVLVSALWVLEQRTKRGSAKRDKEADERAH